MTMVGSAASLDSVPLLRSPSASVIATATYTKALGCKSLKNSATVKSCLHTCLRSQPSTMTTCCL